MGIHKLEKLIEYRMTVEQDHIPIRGNALASGDPQEDKRAEDMIIDDLNSGNIWAWCSVTVVAYIPSIPEIEGTDSLGACSYKSEEDFKRDDYYNDMKAVAKADLLDRLSEVTAALTE